MSSPLCSDDVSKLCNALIRFNLIYRAENESLVNNITGTKNERQGQLDCRNNKKQHRTLRPLTFKIYIIKQCSVLFSASHRKWPKRLVMSRNQTFSESSFFVIVYEPPSCWPHIILFALIGGVIAVCMFPAWPLALKLSTWYISVIVLTFILGCTLLRLVVFLLVWFVGTDLWIFPNLFDEEKGVVDSFRPLYSFEYRHDSWVMVFGRVFLAFLTALCLYQLSQTHSISDAGSFAKRQFLDVLDWGHQKLAAPVKDAALVSKNDEDVPDFTCLRLCGFHDYTTLRDECLNECLCIKELIDSPCYPKCNKSVQNIIMDSQTEICQSSTSPPELHDP